jgi:transposase-like protein
MAQLSAPLLDEDACRGWILRMIHREHGPRCPHCQSAEISVESFWRGRRIRCPGCGGWFTASTGTILAWSALGFREIYLLGVLIGMGLADTAIADRLQINRKTVAEWRRKLKGV